jgi:hypothetical protein
VDFDDVETSRELTAVGQAKKRLKRKRSGSVNGLLPKPLKRPER